MKTRFLLINRIAIATLLSAMMIGTIASSAAKDHKSFAALSARLSEPGGYFDSDNLISNETSYLHVLGKLRELNVSNGVYIGVGPDQNFTYIAKIRPRMAIIIDNTCHAFLRCVAFAADRSARHCRRAAARSDPG